jgi:cyanate lyase
VPLVARKKHTRLKQKISERGLTYRQLSQITGIPLGSLCAKIGGYAAFSSREAGLICQALDIPAEKLFIFF